MILKAIVQARFPVLDSSAWQLISKDYKQNLNGGTEGSEYMGGRSQRKE
jgi:hypothetical protein